MDHLSAQIIIIIGIALSLLIVSIGIVSLFLLYRNKQLQAVQEKETIKAIFQKQLLESQLEIQEQTFNDISQEIHDNVGQILSVAKIQLNMVDQNDHYNGQILADAKESVSKAIIDLRGIARNLNTNRIQGSSLINITKDELDRINRTRLLNASINIVGTEEFIDENKRLIAFRIIQECMSNCIKYSQANELVIEFKFNNQNLFITIQDNGIGFDTSSMKNQGIGLQNIVQRATLIGGYADIQSGLNTGTTITISFPIS